MCSVSENVLCCWCVVAPGDARGVGALRAVESRDTENEASRYLVILVFNALPSRVKNSQLYLLKDEELEDWHKVDSAI